MTHNKKCIFKGILIKQNFRQSTKVHIGIVIHFDQKSWTTIFVKIRTIQKVFQHVHSFQRKIVVVLNQVYFNYVIVQINFFSFLFFQQISLFLGTTNAKQKASVNLKFCSASPSLTNNISIFKGI